jgi:hypothetical protein
VRVSGPERLITRGKPMNPAVFVWMAEVEYLNGLREVVYGDAALLR